MITAHQELSRWLHALLLAIPLSFTACGGGTDSTAPLAQDPVSTLVLLQAPSGFMVRGSTQQVNVEVRNAEGRSLSGRIITWSSSNAYVASVSSSGLVSALAEGLTTISANSEGRTVSFPVQVSESVADITVMSDDDIFEAGTSHQLTARVRDGRGAIVTNAALVWHSHSPALASVSGTGLLSILGTDNDSIVVTAEFGGKIGRFRFFAWPNLQFDQQQELASAVDKSRWFLLRVPVGTTDITVSTAGGTGDADLFVWTPGTWANALQMCKSDSPTNEESCTIMNPQPGLWSVEIFAYQEFADVRLVTVKNTIRN